MIVDEAIPASLPKIAGGWFDHINVCLFSLRTALKDNETFTSRTLFIQIL
jgi:hypothetical protein